MQLAQHTRFIDSDDEDISKSGMQVETAPVGPSHRPPVAPFTTSNFSLLSTISTDYDQKDQCYVLHLAHSPATGTVAAALSNRHIKLFNLKEGGLQFTGSLSGHTGTITSAQCPLLDEPHLLQTTSADGTVREWDLRTGQAARVFTAGNQEIACCTSNGSLLAAGARDNVLFWDRGTGKHISSFTDTHFQDVTQVKFHPVSRGAFVSGSEDGLIAVFNTSGGLDEDEGFKAALNIDTAVAKIGFYGGNGENLWCCSGTETLHLWEWAAACDDESEGGNGSLGQSLDARTKLSLNNNGGDGDDNGGAGGSNDLQKQANGADYLIQCEYDPNTDQLVVIAGNNTGSAALFPVVQPPLSATDVNLEFRPAVAVLEGGHTDVVRSLAWLNGTGPVWVSGGEDARVCVWSSVPGAVGPTPQPSSAVSGGSSGGDSAARHRIQQTHMRRASPY
jgi:WD repeat-containing protein 89